MFHFWGIAIIRIEAWTKLGTMKLHCSRWAIITASLEISSMGSPPESLKEKAFCISWSMMAADVLIECGMRLSIHCGSQIGVPMDTDTGCSDKTHTCKYPSVTPLFWLSGSSSHLWSFFLDCMPPLFISCTTQTNLDILVGEFCSIWFHRAAFPTHCQQSLVSTQHIWDEREVAQRCTMMLKVWPNGWTCLIWGWEGRKRL